MPEFDEPLPDLHSVLGRPGADRRFELLRLIGEGGSISEAARRAGVSYKAAWQAIETLGNLAGTPMVAKAVGGSGGGGTLLTPAGRQVLQAAARLDAARLRVTAELQGAAAPRSAPGAGLAAQALRTSMRNQFPAEVLGLARASAQVRVLLGLGGGLRMTARITPESAQLLGLARGLAVLALCKATAVAVAAPTGAAAAGGATGANLLPGRVLRASRAAAGGEVSLNLGAGLHLVGFAPAGHALRPGHEAHAHIEEAAVVLALPA